jgi:hypothetical protein
MTKKQMQHKIDYEIIVDCYDEIEQSAGWHIYMEENIEFPFKATAQLLRTDGTTVQKEVNVVGLASDEEGFLGKDFFLEIEPDKSLAADKRSLCHLELLGW